MRWWVRPNKEVKLISKPWFSRTVRGARDASKDEALLASLPASSPVNPIQRKSNAQKKKKTSAFTGLKKFFFFFFSFNSLFLFSCCQKKKNRKSKNLKNKISKILPVPFLLGGRLLKRKENSSSDLLRLPKVRLRCRKQVLDSVQGF